MAVPYIFSTLPNGSTIPLSYLDANFTYLETSPSFSGNVTIYGTLSVSAAVTFSSTLSVTGATNLNSTLGVTGATTLYSTLSVSGATSLSSSLSVIGATSLTTLNVSGTVTLSNPLTVPNGGTGITSLAAGRIPYGNGTSALNSSANLTYDGSNLLLGTTTVGGRLTVIDTTGSNSGQLVYLNQASTGLANYAGVINCTGAGTYNTGLYVSAYNAATNYGVRVPNPTLGTNNWGIYVDSAKSYFGGPVGVKTLNPAYDLDVTGTLGVSGHVTLEGVTSTGATGTGNLVFSISPSLTTPSLGDASATSLSLTNALTVGNGGTGQQSFTAGRVIYGAGTAALATNANFIYDGSNLVIGTTTATARLTVYDATGSNSGQLINLNQSSTATVNYAAVVNCVGAGTYNTGLYVSAYNGTYNYGVRVPNPTAGTNNWSIYADAAKAYFGGGVGVKTLNPAYDLDVTGTFGVSGHVTIEGVTSTGATGTGNLVFATSPTLTTPNIGAATGTSLNLSTGKFIADASGNVTAALGYLSNGIFSGTYTDGTVIDYATGNGRISVGSADTLTFYTGGIATTQTAQISTAGVITAAGGVLSPGSSGIGYSTGAGGTVTQGTSRTTGVTLSKISGAITMFSAAGSATPATFTVTNTTVAATDVILLSIKSGATNVYNLSVSAVAAGSFNITFYTTGGTATDAPVINFAVIKAVAA